MPCCPSVRVRTIDASTLTGAGPTAITAQNGVQVSSGATVLLTDSTIRDHSYTGTDNGNGDLLGGWQASGVLFYDAGAGSLLASNTFIGNDMGVYHFAVSSTTTFVGNTFTDNAVGVFADEDDALLGGNNAITGGQYGVAVVSYAGPYGASKATLSGNTITGAVRAAVTTLDEDTNDSAVPVLTVDSGTISGNAKAMWVQGGTATVTGSLIVGNAVGIVNETATQVDGSGNYWGTNTGPAAAA